VLDLERIRSNAPVVGQQQEGLELLLRRGAVCANGTFLALPWIRLHIVDPAGVGAVGWGSHERGVASTECLFLEKSLIVCDTCIQQNNDIGEETTEALMFTLRPEVLKYSH
jgi:hypothetical protein